MTNEVSSLLYMPLIDFTQMEQREEAIERVGKMSVQGVQPKLSAKLNRVKNQFELVDQNGRFILKPQSLYYPSLPENEALSMSLASMIKIEIPFHGLARSKDGSFTYFIERFDRLAHSKKLPVEDFSQLSGRSRDEKYNSSIEQLIKIVNQFCSFPKIEYVELFKRIIFNFLIGNEDMHLKNFSLITRGKRVMLSPGYDFLNTTIVQKHAKEELALPLKGKKNHLTRFDFLRYLAREQLKLNEPLLTNLLKEIQCNLPLWEKKIETSFLGDPLKQDYIRLLNGRAKLLGLK